MGSKTSCAGSTSGAAERSGPRAAEQVGDPVADLARALDLPDEAAQQGCRVGLELVDRLAEVGAGVERAGLRVVGQGEVVDHGHRARSAARRDRQSAAVFAASASRAGQSSPGSACHTARAGRRSRTALRNAAPAGYRRHPAGPAPPPSRVIAWRPSPDHRRPGRHRTAAGVPFGGASVAGTAVRAALLVTTSASVLACRGGTASRSTSAVDPAYRSATARASSATSGVSTGSADSTRSRKPSRPDARTPRAAPDVTVDQPAGEPHPDPHPGLGSGAVRLGHQVVVRPVEVGERDVDQHPRHRQHRRPVPARPAPPAAPGSRRVAAACGRGAVMPSGYQTPPSARPAGPQPRGRADELVDFVTPVTNGSVDPRGGS